MISQTFGKRKSAAIKKAQRMACGCVIQATSQQLVEQDVMKENSHWFMLACRSPLLQHITVHNLRHSREGPLSRNTLWNSTRTSSTDEWLKDIMELFHD